LRRTRFPSSRFEKGQRKDEVAKERLAKFAPEEGVDAVYYGTQMRGVSNAKAKRELNFQPRPLEWTWA
jgi:hypothetical protein